LQEEIKEEIITGKEKEEINLLNALRKRLLQGRRIATRCRIDLLNFTLNLILK